MDQRYIPPFIPSTGAKRVATFRIDDAQKKAVNQIWKRRPEFGSVSEIIQCAVAEFLINHKDLLK
jgi:hypothetical protein